jgi:hypothetical protein
MAGLAKTKACIGVAALLCCLCTPAGAQEFDAPAHYGAHERYRDDLARPYDLDDLELGRDAPIFNSEEVGMPRSRRGTFEWQGPPIYQSLPVLPADPY